MTISAHLKGELRRLRRLVGPVRFGDLSRVQPVSSAFGHERGTPIDRYYIEAFLDRHRDRIAGRGVEIAEPKYLSRFGGQITRRSILVPDAAIARAVSAVDEVVVGDLTNPASLPPAQFDTFICTQTLNFIYDVAGAVEGAHRLLAGGGRFIGTVAGISQISRYDMDRWGDYWRFTTLSLRRLIEDVFGQDAIVESYGNALAAQLFLQGVALEDLPDRSRLDHRDDDYQVIIGFCVEKKR